MTPSRKPVTKSQTNPPRSSWQRRFVQASRCPRSLQPSGATPNQNVPRPQLAPRQARPPWAPLALPPPARPPSRRGRSAEPSGGARGAAATETRSADSQARSEDGLVWSGHFKRFSRRSGGTPPGTSVRLHGDRQGPAPPPSQGQSPSRPAPPGSRDPSAGTLPSEHVPKSRRQSCGAPPHTRTRARCRQVFSEAGHRG